MDVLRSTILTLKLVWVIHKYKEMAERMQNVLLYNKNKNWILNLFTH